MLKKELRVLNLLEIVCAVLIGAELLAFAVQSISGLSVLQKIWSALLLSENILLWIMIALLKKCLSRGRPE